MKVSITVKIVKQGRFFNSDFLAAIRSMKAANMSVFFALKKLEDSQRIRQNTRIERMTENLLKIKRELRKERINIIESQTLVTDSGNEDNP